MSTVQAAVPVSADGSRAAGPSAPRRTLLRDIGGATLMALAFLLPLLVQPAPKKGTELQYGVRTVRLAGPVHVDVNIDSPLFVLLAQDPRLLLTDTGREWQSRPAYITAGWVLAQPFHAIGLRKVGEKVLANRPLPRIPGNYGTYLPEFAGLILLNAMLVVAALVLLRRLLRAERYTAPALLIPAAILLLNLVTKEGFWTPHLQMFNVFVPVLTLSLLVWIDSREKAVSTAEAAAVCAALGVGALAYGAFIIPAAAVSLRLLLSRGRRWRVPKAFVLGAVFFLPMLAWVTFVKARTGSFYSHEVVAYRELVWIADTTREGAGAFVAALGKNLAAYGASLARVLLFPLALLALLWSAVYAAGAARSLDERERRVARASLAYLVVSVPFFALMGYYAPRLTWTVVPAILPFYAFAVARLLEAPRARARRLTTAAVATFVVCYGVVWVARFGPFMGTNPGPWW